MLHTEIEQTDANLADTGLQRPKRHKKQLVNIPEPEPSRQNITVPSSFSSRRTAEHEQADTEALMETTEAPPEPPPPQSIAEDLSCKYL